MPGKYTDALFALTVLSTDEVTRSYIVCVFVDLDKAYGKVPKEEVWYCMRRSGLTEKYVTIVQGRYDDSTTAVRCELGVTEGFEVSEKNGQDQE